MQLIIDETLLRRLTPRQLQALVRINWHMEQIASNRLLLGSEASCKAAGVSWQTWVTMRPLLLESGLYEESEDGMYLVRRPEAQMVQEPLSLSEPEPVRKEMDKSRYTAAHWNVLFDTHIWPHVWLKREKKAARREWSRLAPASLKEAKKLLREIMEGMARYREYVERNAEWYHPQALARWLHGERWKDEFHSESSSGLGGNPRNGALGTQLPIKSRHG